MTKTTSTTPESLAVPAPGNYPTMIKHGLTTPANVQAVNETPDQLAKLFAGFEEVGNGYKKQDSSRSSGEGQSRVKSIARILAGVALTAATAWVGYSELKGDSESQSVVDVKVAEGATPSAIANSLNGSENLTDMISDQASNPSEGLDAGQIIQIPEEYIANMDDEQNPYFHVTTPEE